MGTLPFLPHPPKCEQQVSAGQSSSSSLLFIGDTGNALDEAEQSDDLKDFLNLSGDASDGSFHGENNAMAFDEQMEFQFLSEQLGIAITDNEESPHLDVSELSPLLKHCCSTPELLSQFLIFFYYHFSDTMILGHIRHTTTTVITSSIILPQPECTEPRITS
jgi:hypothetical protein